MEWAERLEPLFGQDSDRENEEDSLFTWDQASEPLSFPNDLDESAGAGAFDGNSRTATDDGHGQSAQCETQKQQRGKNDAFDRFVLLGESKQTGIETKLLPCSRCHSLKLKCDGKIPCWRCVRRGVQEKCCRPAPRSAVDTVMPCRKDGFTSQEEDARLMVGRKSHKAIEYMAILASKRTGFSASWIHAIACNTTPKLFTALTETLEALLAADPHIAQLNPAAMTRKASAKALDLYPSTPFTRYKFDWDDGVIDMDVNRRTMDAFGQHPEEFLDRMARSAVQPVVTDLDMLCTALEELANIIGGPPDETRWTQQFYFSSAFDPTTKKYKVGIFRYTIKSEYDSDGLLRSAEKWMMGISPEEYDAARRAAEIRPLQTALGDRRTAMEVVQTHMHKRYSESIVAAPSAEMHAKLDALADVVRERYGPVIDRLKRRESRKSGAGVGAAAKAVTVA